MGARDPRVDDYLRGNVAALLATRDHVNVFVYDGGIVSDPDGLIAAGQGNSTARTIGSARETSYPRTLCWRSSGDGWPTTAPAAGDA
jgi:ATP-dependent protease HslVU (ClpYQ) peptidase subunit